MSAAPPRTEAWNLEITHRLDDRRPTLVVAGRLGTLGADRLRSALDAATVAHPDLGLDLQGVDYVSSAGIATLSDASERLHQAGGRLRLVRASDAVHFTLHLAGAIPHLEVRPLDAGGRDDPDAAG